MPQGVREQQVSAAKGIGQSGTQAGCRFGRCGVDDMEQRRIA